MGVNTDRTNCNKKISIFKYVEYGLGEYIKEVIPCSNETNTVLA